MTEVVRSNQTDADVLAEAGPLRVRLARNPDEIEAAQQLRYDVFYREMAARPTPEMAVESRDFDDFDAFCDHLLVIDRDQPDPSRVVGTYRLLRQNIAEAHGGFYSADEYDLDPLLSRPDLGGKLMELGRSCVLKEYRNTPTVQLLWRGITSYVLKHGVEVMFGCASLIGTNPDQLAEPLTFLSGEFGAPPEWRVRALAKRYVAMDRMLPDQVQLKRALGALPPLIKAYVRLGAYIGDGAVIDEQFGTTDVFIVLPISRIPKRYYTKFDR